MLECPFYRFSARVLVIFADMALSVSYGSLPENDIISHVNRGARLERFESATDELREAALNDGSDVKSDEHLSASDENSR